MTSIWLDYIRPSILLYFRVVENGVPPTACFRYYYYLYKSVTETVFDVDVSSKCDTHTQYMHKCIYFSSTRAKLVFLHPYPEMIVYGYVSKSVTTTCQTLRLDTIFYVS